MDEIARRQRSVSKVRLFFPSGPSGDQTPLIKGQGSMQITHTLNYHKMVIMSAMLVFSSSGIAFANEAGLVSPPLTIRSGTVVTVRMNQMLSSDHSEVGDLFTATLTQPLVVNGIVVAHRGQNVIGHVVEARKAGRVSGVSRLGITLTDLTVADGQSVPIQSQLLVSDGGRTVRRDSVGVAGTTGLGAAIGAAAGVGTGAAIGAGVGAAAGTLGVLLTRGKPTVIYPETLLTFRVTAPVSVETNSAPQVFRFVERADYAPNEDDSRQVATIAPAVPGYAYPQYVYAAPAYYYPYSYPYYWPGVSLSFAYGYLGYRPWFAYPHYRSYVYAPGPAPFHGGVIFHSFPGRTRH